jgi:hypothetical protein
MFCCSPVAHQGLPEAALAGVPTSSAICIRLFIMICNSGPQTALGTPFPKPCTPPPSLLRLWVGLPPFTHVLGRLLPNSGITKSNTVLLYTVPLRPIRFSESSFHRPEAAEKKIGSYIPFLIWVDLVTRLHAFRFTRLHETKRCLRLRDCRQVCKIIVWLSNCMVVARAAAPTHAAPTHAAAPTQRCRRATRRPPMPQPPYASFILLATTS